MMCEHVRGALLGLQELQKVHKLYTNGKLLLPRQIDEFQNAELQQRYVVRTQAMSTVPRPRSIPTSWPEARNIEEPCDSRSLTSGTGSQMTHGEKPKGL